MTAATASSTSSGRRRPLSTDEIRFAQDLDRTPSASSVAPRDGGRAMELIGALAAGLAIFAGLMAVLPTRAQPAPGLQPARPPASCMRRGSGAPQRCSRRKRLEISPRGYLALSVLAPIGFGSRGVPAIRAMAILQPRRRRVRSACGMSATSSAPEARAASDDAPRSCPMVNRAAAGAPIRTCSRPRPGAPASLGESGLRGDPRALLRQRAAGRRPGRGPATRRSGAEPRARLRRPHRSPEHISRHRLRRKSLARSAAFRPGQSVRSPAR